jgi:hypothetical protein
MHEGRLAVALAATVLAPGVRASGDSLPATLPASGYEAREGGGALDLPEDRADALRRDALSRALLWKEAPDPADMDLGRNPADLLGGAEEAACRFHPDRISGRTAKFDCVFAGGEVLKVKYGGSPEIHTEVAATRLLRALGAGADFVSILGRLRCFGCPEDPERLLRCISTPFEEYLATCAPIYGERTATGELQVEIDYGRFVDFTMVAVERKLEGRTVRAGDVEGWGFDELDEAGAGTREAGRAQRDALRLLAVLLNNWDNRRDNQRLVCLEDGAVMADGGCHAPFAYMQDVGGTFGRVGPDKSQRKLDLEGWRSVPVWRDWAACRVAVDSPALHGATFGEAVVSEGGRAFLARRLARLTEQQIRDLFEGARFADHPEAGPQERDVEQWVVAFRDKVRQIADREPCPTP